MATQQSESDTVYEVYCRECDWQAADPIELKGTANLLAGRHISETDHVVALKAIETASEADDEFYRGRDRSVAYEILRRADAESANVRHCGPVDCVVETP